MTRDELLDRLHELQYTACFNQRYHQAIAKRWSWWDRGAKIVVGFATGAGVVTSAVAPSWLGLIVSVLSLAAAVVLNVFPFSDWEQRSQQLFIRWTDLRRDVEALDYDVRLTHDDVVPHSFVTQITRLNDKRHEIEADEPAPEEKLMHKVQRAENISRGFAADSPSTSTVENPVIPAEPANA